MKKHECPAFSRKAVANIWQEIQSKQWKRDEDELVSAKKLLQEYSDSGTLPDKKLAVQEVVLPELDGFKAIAFVLPHLLGTWGTNIREIALDSTCMVA